MVLRDKEKIISFKRPAIWVASLVLALGMGAAGTLYADYEDCAAFETQTDLWTLELVDVTVDGEPLADQSAYEDLTFSITSEGGKILFHALGTESRQMAWRVWYSQDEMPEEFLPYIATSGGE